jgi:hypothetical protein
MPSHDFGAGDLCFCKVYICNTSMEAFEQVPVFVVLDVYGTYIFAPDFNSFSHYLMDIPRGKTKLEVIPAFLWPEGAGSANGIKWYAAMTDQSMSSITGELGTFEFGWH